MRKTTLMLLFVSILFVGFTACKKSDNKKTDDTDNPGDGDGDGDNTSADAAAALKGSDYYLFMLDGTTEAKIHSKVTKDYRVDEANRFLFVWDDTYTEGTPSGPNSFGEVESWLSMKVAGIPAAGPWSGLGISPDGKSVVDLTGVTNDHVLHFAMKSKVNATYVVGLSAGDATTEEKIAIGSANFEDNGKTLVPKRDFPRDGEWHHIEIPMSEFFNGALKYRAPGFSTGNVFLVLSGGNPSTTLDIDGVFIYKPAK